MASLKAVVSDLQDGYVECCRRLEQLEEKLSNPTAISTQDKGTVPALEEVRRITRQEMEIEARKNNVVLAGVSCSDSTNVEEVVKTLLPDIQIEVLAVKKLGGKQRTHGSGSVSDQPPSRILVDLTPRGKAALWERRRSLTCNEKPVYVNHDLTRAEQASRRAVVPTYKQLRAAGIRCSLPRCSIVLDGKVMSSQDIQEALQSILPSPVDISAAIQGTA